MGTTRQSIQFDHPIPAKSGGMWKKGTAAYREQIQARLNLIQNQPTKAPGAIKGLNQALQQVQHHWIGDQTWAQFLVTQQHWQQYRDDRTFELLQHTVQHQLEEAQQQNREESLGQIPGKGKGSKILPRVSMRTSSAASHLTPQESEDPRFTRQRATPQEEAKGCSLGSL